MTITRTLPHDLAAESSLLGAVLIAGARVLDQVSDLVTADDFFRKAHRTLWEAFTALQDANQPLDLVTVKDALGANLEDVGGLSYVSSLTDGVPKSTNAPFYAQIVRAHAQRRRIIQLALQAITEAYEAEKPVNELLRAVDSEVLKLQGDARGDTVRLSDVAHETYADLEFHVEHRGQVTGVASGFETIDLLTSGWQPGDLIVIAARPSIGKTMFALNMAANTSIRGPKHTLIFSLEMRRRQLQHRLLSNLSGVAMARIRSGFLGEADFERLAPAQAELHDARVTINDRAHQTASSIRATCRQVKHDGGLDLVIVDYFQLISGNQAIKRDTTRNEVLSEVSRRLKILADELQCPIVVLSQLSRASERRSDGRPQLSDLRDTGALEQDADVVGFLHREKHNQDGVTEFIVEKQRNGPTGVVHLRIERDTQTFTDVGLEPEEPVQDALPDTGAKSKRTRRPRPYGR